MSDDALLNRQFHYFPRDLKTLYLPEPSETPEEQSRTVSFSAPHSKAYWAFKPNGTAIVFVHGFNGHATKTWEAFPRYLFSTENLNRYSRFQGTDVLFYGYESLTLQIWANAGRLFDLLQALSISPADSVINRTLPKVCQRSANFRYDRIIVVGHSLGSVLARKALLQADGKPWMKMILLLLFAPADFGAHLPILLKEAMLPFTPLRFLLGFVGLYAQSIEGISVGSDRLKKLRSDILARVKDDQNSPLRARCVIHGSYDRVVVQDEFLPGELMVRIDCKGHVNVCKPSSNYDRPLNIVMEYATK